MCNSRSNENLNPVLSRRKVIGNTCGLGLVGFGMPSFSALAFEEQRDDPRFFLHLNLSGGFDSSYLFDSRPRDFVSAGKKALYLSEEPEIIEGINGGRCWATAEAAPLKEFFGYFSVLNGVQMATGFDGHVQNANFLATGNPFGGEYFVPLLNNGRQAALLDYIQSGFSFPFEASNSQNGVPFSPYSASTLIKRLKENSTTSLNQARSFAQRRMEKIGEGKGKTAAGSRSLLSAHKVVPKLETLLSQMEVPSSESGIASALNVASQAFIKGLSRSAFVEMEFNGDLPDADAHAPETAKRSSQLAAAIVEQLLEVFRYLRSTPYDATRSMMDVTTVMFASEFGRTMRQSGVPIEESGTDHNPLTNSIIVAGKGVRGNQIIGASDFQTVDEVATGAHLQLDRDQIKQMGMPFDHKNAKVRSDRPGTFKAQDYLGMANVANSILTSFGVGTSRHWVSERNGPIAVPIVGLFS